MRNILLLFLMLLLLTSCRVESNGSTPQESVTSSDEQTAISSELITVTNITSPPTENSLIDNIFLIDEPYSFSEVNPLLGPGPFSVNELSEIFGEPSFVEGYYNDRNVKSKYYVISVMFKDAKFDLVANNNEELNLILTEDGIYKVPNSAMDVQMKPKYVSVFNGDWTLPRGIKLGDSIESLYNAYNGNSGTERSAQGEVLISYDYGESGSIIYHFADTGMNSVISGLKQVTIEWYNDNELNNSTQSVQSPSPLHNIFENLILINLWSKTSL